VSSRVSATLVGSGTLLQMLAEVFAWPVRCARQRFLCLEQEDDRRELLQLSEAQLGDVVRFCNRYPDIQMAHQVLDADNVHAGEQARYASPPTFKLACTRSQAVRIRAAALAPAYVLTPPVIFAEASMGHVGSRAEAAHSAWRAGQVDGAAGARDGGRRPAAGRCAQVLIDTLR